MFELKYHLNKQKLKLGGSIIKEGPVMTGQEGAEGVILPNLINILVFLLIMVYHYPVL